MNSQKPFNFGGPSGTPSGDTGWVGGSIPPLSRGGIPPTTPRITPGATNTSATQSELDLNGRASPPERCPACGKPIPHGRWIQIASGIFRCLPCAVREVRERKEAAEGDQPNPLEDPLESRRTS